MKETELEEILRFYEYDSRTGEVHNKKTGRLLMCIEEEPSVSVYLSDSKKLKKILLPKLCWHMGTAKANFPEKHKILHKNLDFSDNRLSNLVLIPSGAYSEVKAALDNLQIHLKLSQHPYDQYNYVVKWRDAGVLKTETYEDVTAAKNRYSFLQLKFAKIVGKYCNL